jgi:hypothetical protein
MVPQNTGLTVGSGAGAGGVAVAAAGVMLGTVVTAGAAVGGALGAGATPWGSSLLRSGRGSLIARGEGSLGAAVALGTVEGSDAIAELDGVVALGITMALGVMVAVTLVIAVTLGAPAPGLDSLTGFIAATTTTPAVTAMATPISTGLFAGLPPTSGMLTGAAGTVSAACASAASPGMPSSRSSSPPTRTLPSALCRASSMRKSESTTILCIFVRGLPSGSSTGPLGSGLTNCSGALGPDRFASSVSSTVGVCDGGKTRTRSTSIVGHAVSSGSALAT